MLMRHAGQKPRKEVTNFFLKVENKKCRVDRPCHRGPADRAVLPDVDLCQLWA